MEEMRERATGDETVSGTVSLAGLEGVTAWARSAVEDVKGPTRGLSPADLAADIRGLQRVISALTAAQTVRIAHYASRDEERGSDGVWRQVDRGTGHVADFAGDDLAPMLGMAPMTAKRRVHTAAKLTTDLPKTLRAVADGDLDGFRAQIVADETILADRDTCAAVEEIVHPRILDDTPGAVRRRVRRALTVIDPEAVRLAAKKARMERHVRTREGEFPGMTEWWASLPAEDSAKCWAAIDELAQRIKADDPARTIDQCRADALVDLIPARAEVIRTLTLAVPAHVFGAGSSPGEHESGDSHRRDAQDDEPVQPGQDVEQTPLGEGDERTEQPKGDDRREVPDCLQRKRPFHTVTGRGPAEARPRSAGSRYRGSASSPPTSRPG